MSLDVVNWSLLEMFMEQQEGRYAWWEGSQGILGDEA